MPRLPRHLHNVVDALERHVNPGRQLTLRNPQGLKKLASEHHTRVSWLTVRGDSTTINLL